LTDLQLTIEKCVRGDCLHAFCYSLLRKLHGVRSQKAGFGSGQGRSKLATAGVAWLRRGLTGIENAVRGRKMSSVGGHQAEAALRGRDRS
jgi:hypothetical protein